MRECFRVDASAIRRASASIVARRDQCTAPNQSGKSGNAVRTAESGFVFHVRSSVTQNKIRWIVDFGALSHMTNDQPQLIIVT